ncbi:hypothetical protein ABEU20_002613 [Rhodococcus sp. PAM 2766]|uniref:Abortive infection protein-like C-terminal domain-containing protein n=1 Tax=Rhodococcus parequi TaxID=3137122 RepID=A0ABW9FFU8_9NOCA
MDDSFMLGVAVRAKIRVAVDTSRTELMNSLLQQCLNDQDKFLDVIDAVLSFRPDTYRKGLARTLLDAGSAWTVSAEGDSLERRVDATAREQFELASSPDDDAARELREAWAQAYGLTPDPSDAWDHAIKAVEAALWPLVVPKNPTATLGTIEKAIVAKPSKWNLALESNSIGGVETLHALLKMMWPNPDRHATGATRVPTQQEAEGVVQIAVLIVQWVRAGMFTLENAPAGAGPLSNPSVPVV